MIFFKLYYRVKGGSQTSKSDYSRNIRLRKKQKQFWNPLAQGFLNEILWRNKKKNVGPEWTIHIEYLDMDRNRKHSSIIMIITFCWIYHQRHSSFCCNTLQFSFVFYGYWICTKSIHILIFSYWSKEFKNKF